MLNKKMKIILGTCIPVATLGVAAGVTAGIILATRTEPEVGKYTVTYKTTDGRKIINGITSAKAKEGATLEKVKQAEVELKANELFLQWNDENGNKFSADQYISRDTTLTAQVVNADADQLYARVTFNKGSKSGVRIYGNSTVAVRKGKIFADINRPAAALNGYEFLGWALQDGKTKETDCVPSTYEFTADTPLYPVFAKKVTLNFEIGAGATIEYGSTSEVRTEGSKFSEYNKPQVSNGAKYLEGWKKSDGTMWTGTDVVTDSNNKAIAVWIDEPAGLLSTLTFANTAYFKDGSTEYSIPVTYENGASTLKVRKNLAWNQMNKPVAIATDAAKGDNYRYNFKLDHYQYNAGTSAAPVWTDITDTQTFTADTAIRPVLVKTVGDVFVSGDNAISPGNEYTYYGYATGGAELVFDWEFKAWIGNDWTADKTAINNAGITFENVTTEGSPINNVFKVTLADNVTATKIKFTLKHKYAPSVTKDKEVSINSPYLNSHLCWVLYSQTVSEVTTYKWASTTVDNLCSTDAISLTTPSGTAIGPIARTSFNYPVYIGDKLSTLPANFLQGCTSFNSELHLNNITQIQDGFMNGCTAYNNNSQTLSLTNVKTICDDFMFGCTAWNNALTINATDIGKHFLQGCSSFNAGLTLSGTKTIEEGFLAECIAFNQSLSMPSTLTWVGSSFMKNANAFAATITIPNAGVFEADEHSLCGSSKSADIYAKGFSVAGAGAAEFTTKFPTIEFDDIGCYRTNKSEEITIIGDSYVGVGDSTQYSISNPYLAVTSWSIDSKQGSSINASIDNNGNLSVTGKIETLSGYWVKVKATLANAKTITRQINVGIKIKQCNITAVEGQIASARLEGVSYTNNVYQPGTWLYAKGERYNQADTAKLTGTAKCNGTLIKEISGTYSTAGGTAYSIPFNFDIEEIKLINAPIVLDLTVSKV